MIHLFQSRSKILKALQNTVQQTLIYTPHVSDQNLLYLPSQNGPHLTFAYFKTDFTVNLQSTINIKVKQCKSHFTTVM